MKWLQENINENGHWDRGEYSSGNREWGGDTALVCLALLYADESPNAEYLSKALDWLANQQLTGTYAVALRAHALSRVGRGRFDGVIRNDLRWLIRAAGPPNSPNEGAYGYVEDDSRGNWWDNSNSQYGVLGVWTATEVLADPGNLSSYWDSVRDHWLKTQLSDGGWSYRGEQTATGSMTVAGIATLFVVLDRLESPSGRITEKLRDSLNAALDWLGREFTPNNPNGPGQWRYYYLYGVERAGRASGFKYFRTRDWFRTGARFLVDEQESTGAWGGDDIGSQRNTAFALMFLCHGRAPLLFNKLDTSDDWASRPRDVAGLTWYAQTALERLLNWQIVTLDGTLTDLLEAPVLYFSDRKDWKPSSAEVQKIREYCLRGGLLFGVAENGSENFVASFKALAEAAFPEYRLTGVSQDHPLFSGGVQFPIEDPPLMLEVHNGVRSLMLLSTRDLGNVWSRFRTNGALAMRYQLGVNVYLYATDRRIKTSRLQSNIIQEKPVETRRTIRVGRVQHSGDWSIEPYGWVRLAAYLHNETGTRLLVSTDVDASHSSLREQFDVLHMTGTTSFELTQDEMQGLRRFLTAGGVLIADAASGSQAFTESFEAAFTQILKTEPVLVPENAALLTGSGLPDAVDLAGTGYRRSARQRASLIRDRPALRAYSLGGRMAVIYSPLDLSAGLLGTEIFGCAGYEAESVLHIMRNLLLYSSLSSIEQSRISADS
ncbi:MAG: DUF4159 domain-containing protein [Phycisphaerae bacterium]